MEAVNYEERYPTVVTAQNTPQQHRPVENYEERYPTVVDAQNTPQHFPQAVTEDSPKYSTSYPIDQKKPLTPHKDSYPEVVTPLDPYAQSVDPAYPNAIPPKEDVYHEPVVGAAARGKRYCGMSKRAFLLVLALVIVIIVGGVGGAVGGVMAGKSKKETSNISGSGNGSSATNGTSSSVAGSTATQTSVSGVTSDISTGTAAATATTGSSTGVATPTSLATALDTSKSIGSLGVSTFQNTDAKVYVHLYYQQGSNIAYRVYTGSGYFKTPQALDLTTAPKSGTPLTAVETSSSGNTYVSLFYIDASNNIILANYTSTLGSVNLTLTSTSKLVASTSVHSSSQLAAIYLGPQYGYRLYYQAASGVLQEHVGVGGKWQTGAALQATALPGSPITISSITTPKMNIFYVDSTAKTLFTVYYSGGWSTGAALSTTSLNSWNGTNTALAAISQTNTAYLRTYYIGSDKEIYEMLDPAAGTTWSKNSDQSAKWPNADFTAAGSLVGIGWDDQVRIYYVSGGNIEQLALNSGIWGVSNNIGGSS